MTSLLAAAALTTRLRVMAEVSDPSVAVNVYVPDLFRKRLLNVAIPFTAVAVSVLLGAKLASTGPVFTVIVIGEGFDTTTLP